MTTIESVEMITKFPYKKIYKYVKRGAKLLDTQKPGWATHMSLDAMALSNGEACILGQSYNGYSRGVDTLSEVDDDFQAHKYGFEMNMELVEQHPDLIRLKKKADESCTTRDYAVAETAERLLVSKYWATLDSFWAAQILKRCTC